LQNEEYERSRKPIVLETRKSEERKLRFCAGPYSNARIGRKKLKHRISCEKRGKAAIELMGNGRGPKGRELQIVNEFMGEFLGE